MLNGLICKTFQVDALLEWWICHQKLVMLHICIFIYLRTNRYIYMYVYTHIYGIHIYRMNPPPSNSHHQDYNMFSRSLLKKPSFATVCWEKLDPIHTPESSSRVCGGWTSTPKTEGLVIPWRFGSPEGRSLNWEVSRVDRWVHPLWKWIFSWNSQILKKVKPLNKGPIQNHDLTCAFFYI